MADEMLNDLVELCAQRDSTYALLARLYRVEVDQPLLDGLHATRFPAATGSTKANAGYRALAEYLSNIDERSTTELAVDFARVFIGYGVDSYAAAFPFESVYTSEKRLKMQEARDEVLAIYHAYGLDKSSEWEESEDHVAAELEFMQVLCARTTEALKAGDEDKAAQLLQTQKKFLEDNPDFDYDQDVADATKVADAMKAEGWEFASHTWGHMNATERSAEDLKTDDQKWKSYVAPILGDTDMIIFAFGADIGDWSGYSSDNPKFQYYKSAGYDYFCNVDSSQYFVQITDQYFRQGRRNLDGYRMYYNPEMLSDLFDVADVWDSSRPTPVPQM